MLTLTISAFAGRFMELEHWQAVEKVKKARAEAELGKLEGARGRQGKNMTYPSPRLPFKDSH
jgi:hypothetical protein